MRGAVVEQARGAGAHRVEEVMGIPVGIDVRATGAGEQAIDRAFARLRAIDAAFSTYRRASDISRIGRGTLALADAHPDVRAVLARCDGLRAQTGGWFDVAAAGRLDPAAFVKGWAVDEAARILVAAGARSLCIHAGGDVRVLGERAAGRPWRIGVQHPLRRDRVAAVLEARDLAVATSGAYERGPHVIDPHTGRPPDGVLSVTVAGPDLGTADAYATAAFAMGLDGPVWTATLEGFEALTILADGRVLSTPGMARLRGD
ncbi:MAG: FAD:protein transferase [Solirubrobacteraceae bacterium]|jgi:thiamine biosynthesis lipoprotein|nr:FAD:protein transferase [Solirubrobacteraceae bacterium]